MFSKRPIRVKVLVGLGLLLLLLAILSGSGLYTTYAYRSLVRTLRLRVSELPVAAELSQHVGNLQVTLTKLRGLRAYRFPSTDRDTVPTQVLMRRDEFRIGLDDVEETLARYRRRLEHKLRSDPRIADNQKEWETVHRIERALERVHEANRDEDWMLDLVKISQLETELEHLQELAAELPSHLHHRLGGFAVEVRNRYRTLIVGTWIAGVLAMLVLALFMRLSYQWVFRPLQTLIAGSRRVAGGEFDYRIRLDTNDEMAELARAMNDMTARFQAIRDDLDNQVRERTQQVVRGEQLASVGFLAAGVAHEINNPLASIALCAESLESRIREVLDEHNHPVGGVSDGDPATPSGGGVAGVERSEPPETRTCGVASLHHSHPPVAKREIADGAPPKPSSDDPRTVIGNYLRMIQTEAFRCKEITEKLLDFSRMGEVRRQRTELGELVQGVIEMLGHLGKYHDKHIQFTAGEPVIVTVAAQEIKQVVLNLLTNALDSCDPGGTVRVELADRGDFAELTVTDDGCGMAPEVLKHVFEPFFTRRRSGQGTGLGLSITYRIVAEHGGDIQAQSPGPGRGSTFRVRLPLIDSCQLTAISYQPKSPKKRCFQGLIADS